METATEAHYPTPTALCYSSDGRFLAAAYTDGSLRQWDCAGALQKELATGRGGTLSMYDRVVYSRDDKTIAFGGWTGTGIWDLTSGRTHWIGGRAQTIAFWNDAVLIAFEADQELRAYDCDWSYFEYWITRSRDTHPDDVILAFSSDRKTAVSGGADGFVRLWDMSTSGMKIIDTFFPFPDEDSPEYIFAITAASFSNDGRWLACGNDFGETCLIDLAARAVVRPAERIDRINCVEFSRDGRLFASAGRKGDMHVWHTDTGLSGYPLQFRAAPNILSIAFAPDGNTIASASQSGAITVWDIASGQMTMSLHALPNGNWLAQHSDGRASHSEGASDYLRFDGPLPVPLGSYEQARDGCLRPLAAD
jgi:WD40 repeat protein